MNYRRFIPYCILPITLLVTIVCDRPAPEKQKPAPSHILRVSIGPVLRDSIVLPLFLPGKLSAATELRLGFKTGGIIREINAIEGASVSRGARIARLDTVEFSAWRDKAQTALEKTSRDLARAEQLLRDSVAPLEQVQNARSAWRAARSDSAIAAFNLSQAILAAPTSGKILKRLAEKNEVIGPGMPVVIFASTDGNWVVKAAIPDRDLNIITLGDRAEISFDALPDRIFPATLSRIAGAAHPVTGTFEIELSLTEIDRQFRPGLIADVKLYPSAQKKHSYVPAGALVEGTADSALVYGVTAEGTFTPEPIRIGRIFGDLVAVASGLEGIDTVVVSGAPYLRFTADSIIVDRGKE